MLDYPATWTVSGEGSRQPTETWPSAATWKTKGSAPGVRMAIYVRQSDKRLIVFLRNEQLSAPNATTGTEQTAGTATIRSRLQPISNAVYEWRPFPTIQDAPTSMHITGSSTTPLSRLDATQPLGTSGQAICTWDLVQGSGRAVTSSASGGAAGAASSANAAGGAVSTTDIANRVPARVAAIAPRTITLTGFTATGLSTTVSPRTIALAGFTASGPASAVAPRTIALAGFSARGTPAIAPRTIALTGFTAAGTASAVAPRTIALAGFTASGTAAVVGPRTIPLSGFTATGSTSTVAPRTIPLAGWTSAGP